MAKLLNLGSYSEWVAAADRNDGKAMPRSGKVGKIRGAACVYENANTLRELGEAEDVAVRILEPRDFGAAGGGPDAFGVLGRHAEMLKADALLF